MNDNEHADGLQCGQIAWGRGQWQIGGTYFHTELIVVPSQSAESHETLQPASFIAIAIAIAT